MKSNSSAIVIGAGIVGLAAARALSLKGYAVTVIERSEKAVGASIRNFGMIWPIGQPDGVLYQRAIRSKMIWQEMADSMGSWYDECGSLHIANKADEWDVLRELEAAFSASGRPVQLLNKFEINKRFTGINTENIIGGLYSPTEMIIDPRESIVATASYLEEYLKIDFLFGKNVSGIESGKVILGKQILQADLIVLCNGADFETLYPDLFISLAITKCKLQMMRFTNVQGEPRIGVSVCGGLSLIHYNSFKAANSLPILQKRYETEMAEYLKWGIHVMVSQNEAAELTVGDSHEYGNTFDPFDRFEINQLVMEYLAKFVFCNNWKLTQSWNGIYAKMTNGETEVFLNPEPGVYILNGLGGAGMTLSFGLAEEKLATL